MKKLFPVFTAIILLFLASCYYDNEEALYPSVSSGCDTTNITFSGTIVPVLSNNCYNCHSNASAASYGNNVRLENYADIQSRIAAVVGTIKHTGSYSPMPKNGGKLNECSILKLDIWVRQGMLNN
jgi:hypothetical protein